MLKLKEHFLQRKRGTFQSKNGTSQIWQGQLSEVKGVLIKNEKGHSSDLKWGTYVLEIIKGTLIWEWKNWQLLQRKKEEIVEGKGALIRGEKEEGHLYINVNRGTSYKAKGALWG